MSTGRMNYDDPSMRYAGEIDDIEIRRRPGFAPSDPMCGPQPSWLGDWKGVGWAIRITPRLTSEQWAQFNKRCEETWDNELINFSAERSLALLHELYPDHEFTVVWPVCGKRFAGGGVCGVEAHHTEVHLKDAYGKRVAISRCTDHKGQL